MSRLSMKLLFIFSSGCLVAQSLESKWEKFLEDAPVSGPFYLVSSQSVDDQFTLIRRLDENNSIVRIDDVSGVRSEPINPVNNLWKLNISDRSSGDVFYLTSIGEVDFDGVEVLGRYNDIYLIKASERAIERLIQNPSVVHVSNESAIPETEARVIDMNLNPNRINKIHHFFPGLDGTSMTVSIQENGFDVADIDLLGRNVASTLRSSTTDNHATEMATIVAGAGNSFVTGKGVAGHARITSSDFSMVLPDADADYVSLDVITQNHSFGTEIESFYGAQARAFDQSAFNNRNLLHVFSSGNQGMEVPQEGSYAGISGFSNLTGNFKMAKNVLVVGSVDTTGNEVLFASRGPAYDGRVKPEVVAYSVVGSSNSAALVTGISTLMQQQYRALKMTDIPSALLKAFLINTAEDVGPEGVDYVTGYGNVNAYRGLQSLSGDQFFAGNVSEGEIQQFPISLPAGIENLKITLCWTDPPSEAGSFKALVNDLDIRLVNSMNVQTLPWILNSGETVDELAQRAVRGIDRLNNVEQISLDEVDDSNYAIEVLGFDVSGSQDFYLAWQYDIADTFEWDYPTGSDHMPYNGESGSYFRWKSTLPGSSGVLEFSTDNGTNWQLLDNNVDLSTGYWRWNEIPDLNATSIVRMTVGSQSFMTEGFTISTPLEVTVGFVCADSVRLQWPGVAGVSHYNVLNMGNKNLEHYQTVADTALVIEEAGDLTDTRFSVIPFIDSTPLISSVTQDYTRQAIECFVFSFFQEVSLDTGIYLNLRLGTTYGVEQLTFQRKSKNSNSIIATIDSPESSELRILDETPNQGNNTHSIIIEFINGEQIEQEVTDTYYLTEVPLLVFPNPIGNSTLLNVFTKEFEGTDSHFRIIDSRGIEVTNVPINSTQNTIPLNGLRAGIYFYELKNGIESNSGRLVIK